MPRLYNIKWRAEDEREISRTLKNFNAKVRREYRKNPSQRSALPQFFDEDTGNFRLGISSKQFKRNIRTRADLRRELNSLKRFSKRGAEKIVAIPENYNQARTTRWQLQEMGRRAGIVNTKRGIRLENKKNIELADRMAKTGFTYGEAMKMGMKSDVGLKPTSAYTEGMRQEDVKWKYRSLMTESQQSYYSERDRQLKENFIKGLERTYSKKEIAEVAEKIRSMSPEEFVLKYDQKTGSAFEDIYFPNKNEKANYLKEIKNYWLGENITD